MAEKSEFTKLLEYLRATRGFDFGGYKVSTLMRRVQKRMGEVGVESYADYIDFLEVHPDEFQPLFNTVLINVTSFFRDPPAWEYVAQEVLPRILADRAPDRPIRVWSAGCASGEEAYTIALLLVEALGEEAFRQRVKIYATDADEEALLQARQGSFEERQAGDIPAPLLEKYFERVNGRFVFRSDLRRSLIFGRHDLVQDAAISRVDLLVCRNALMYFNCRDPGADPGALPFRSQPRGLPLPRQGRDAAHPRQQLPAGGLEAAGVPARRQQPTCATACWRSPRWPSSADLPPGGAPAAPARGGLRAPRRWRSWWSTARASWCSRTAGAAPVRPRPGRPRPPAPGLGALLPAGRAALAPRGGLPHTLRGAGERRAMAAPARGEALQLEIRILPLLEEPERCSAPASPSSTTPRRATCARSWSGPTRSWRPPTRSCSRPTRSWRPPTRSCSRPSRSWRPPTRSCSRPTKSWRP